MDSSPQSISLSFKESGQNTDTEYFYNTFTSGKFENIRLDVKFSETSTDTQYYQSYKDIKMVKMTLDE